MTLDQDTVEHESAHAAAAIMLGIEVTSVDCVGNGTTCAGQIRHVKTDDWQALAKTLMASGIPPGWPPNASRSNDTASAYDDVAHLRTIIEAKRLTAPAYYLLRVQAETLTSSPQFKALKERIGSALGGNGGYLDERDVADIVARWRWDTAHE